MRFQGATLIYFLGFTLYCTRNLKGNFKVGMKVTLAAQPDVIV